MSTAFLRDGKLVPGNILKGVDVKKLNSSEQQGAFAALQKAENGERLTLANAEALLKARAKGRS